MLEIAIIADDLTGAADTGVQFCPYFNKTILTSYNNLLRDAFTVESQALAIYTNSRSMQARPAGERVRHVANRLDCLQPKQIYKKVDSCLRGNIGAEVDAIVDEMGFDLSFISPAFPAMGRTTLHDLHLIDGTPVAETELSRDPVTPVTVSRLSRVVAEQSRYHVEHVDVSFMDRMDDRLNKEIERLAISGARHLAFDATRDGHLDRIARLAIDSSKKILLVGSAGLADSFGRHFRGVPMSEENEPAISPEGNHLLVCGSVSERMKLQISMLLEKYPYEVITLSPYLLADQNRREELLLNAQNTARVLSSSPLIIRIGDPGEEMLDEGANQQPSISERIADGLGFFVATILKEERPATLFLSGGDTADAVLNTIGMKGIRLYKEVITGLGQGTLIGGLIDGLPVVTKAGAFGKDDTLVALHDYWQDMIKENKHDR